eukprot:7125549-Pyramimonas_sp.AAC.1
MAESRFLPRDAADNLTRASCVVSTCSKTLGAALHRNASVRPVVDEGLVLSLIHISEPTRPEPI